LSTSDDDHYSFPSGTGNMWAQDGAVVYLLLGLWNIVQTIVANYHCYDRVGVTTATVHRKEQRRLCLDRGCIVGAAVHDLHEMRQAVYIAAAALPVVGEEALLCTQQRDPVQPTGLLHLESQPSSNLLHEACGTLFHSTDNNKPTLINAHSASPPKYRSPLENAHGTYKELQSMTTTHHFTHHTKHSTTDRFESKNFTALALVGNCDRSLPLCKG
jgi:hypothetical protein